MSYTRYSLVTGKPANRNRRTRASPRNGFRARPTWRGPVGFALVCSKRIFSFRGGDLPYPSPMDRTDARTCWANGPGSIWKFTYGPPAGAPRTEGRPSGGRCGPRSRRGTDAVPSPTHAWRGRRDPRPPAHPTPSPGGRNAARTRWRAAPAPPGPGARTTDRGPLRHPEPQDRGDSAERPEEELALFRILGDQLHVRAHLAREVREVLDELAVLEDGEGPAVRRARRQLARIIDGLLALPIAVRAP